MRGGRRDREAAKAAQLNAVAFHQSVAHRVKQGFDGKFRVAVGQLRETRCQFFNQITAGHVYCFERA